MKLFSGLAKTALLALTMGSSYGTISPYIGNAYGPSNTAGTRATWAGQMLSLTYDDVDLATECTGGCAYTYNSGPATPLNNVSGQTISGVKFVGANSTTGAGLYVRPINSGTRNSGTGGFPNYNALANADFTQWVYGLATIGGTAGTPSLTITLPTGTRSVGFDFGNINSTAANISITTTSASTSDTKTPANRYDTAAGTPSYLTTGAGFYGATSTDDILTISIVANASTSAWILNIANFRVGVQINQPTPEPATQLTFAAALIALSIVLRRRNGNTPGGTA